MAKRASGHTAVKKAVEKKEPSPRLASNTPKGRPVNETLKDIEPSIIIATLTALLAEYFKDIQNVQVLFINSTVLFSVGAIFYYFYRTFPQRKNLVPILEILYITLNAGGFILFLTGVFFVVSPNLIPPIVLLSLVLICAIVWSKIRPK